MFHFILFNFCQLWRPIAAQDLIVEKNLMKYTSKSFKKLKDLLVQNI